MDTSGRHGGYDVIMGVLGRETVCTNAYILPIDTATTISTYRSVPKILLRGCFLSNFQNSMDPNPDMGLTCECTD